MTLWCLSFPICKTEITVVFFCLPNLFESWTVMPIWCFNNQVIKICINEVKYKNEVKDTYFLPGFSTCLLKEGEILLQLRLQNQLGCISSHQQIQPGRSKRKAVFLRITVRELLNSLKRGVSELTLDLLGLLFLYVGSQQRRVHRIFRVVKKAASDVNLNLVLLSTWCTMEVNKVNWKY